MTENFNQALVAWDGFCGLPRFDAIRDDDFAPAFEWALEDHNREISEIAENPDAPTFENTIDALEISGDPLSRVT